MVDKTFENYTNVNTGFANVYICDGFSASEKSVNFAS